MSTPPPLPPVNQPLLAQIIQLFRMSPRWTFFKLLKTLQLSKSDMEATIDWLQTQQIIRKVQSEEKTYFELNPKFDWHKLDRIQEPFPPNEPPTAVIKESNCSPESQIHLPPKNTTQTLCIDVSYEQICLIISFLAQHPNHSNLQIRTALHLSRDVVKKVIAELTRVGEVLKIHAADKDEYLFSLRNPQYLPNPTDIAPKMKSILPAPITTKKPLLQVISSNNSSQKIQSTPTEQDPLPSKTLSLETEIVTLPSAPTEIITEPEREPAQEDDRILDKTPGNPEYVQFLNRFGNNPIESCLKCGEETLFDGSQIICTHCGFILWTLPPQPPDLKLNVSEKQVWSMFSKLEALLCLDWVPRIVLLEIFRAVFEILPRKSHVRNVPCLSIAVFLKTYEFVRVFIREEDIQPILDQNGITLDRLRTTILAGRVQVYKYITDRFSRTAESLFHASHIKYHEDQWVIPQFRRAMAMRFEFPPSFYQFIAKLLRLFTQTDLIDNQSNWRYTLTVGVVLAKLGWIPRPIRYQYLAEAGPVDQARLSPRIAKLTAQPKFQVIDRWIREHADTVGEWKQAINRFSHTDPEDPPKI